MNKLISAGFTRLWRDKPFWICCAFMFLYGAVIYLRVGANVPLEAIAFAFAVLIGLPSAAFCSLFMGTEYSDGTIRNKIIVGHSKSTVYFSSLIVNFFACLCMAVSCVVAILIVGVLKHGSFQAGFEHMLLYAFVAGMMIFAYASIYTLLGMLITNKATAAVVCVLLSFVLFAPSITIHSRLSEPEFYEAPASNSAQTQQRPNPKYLTGAKRTVYSFLYDLIPTCQGMQIAQASKDVAQLPLFSAGIIIVSSGVGVFLFRRKDLK
jgi:hypothetical protein